MVTGSCVVGPPFPKKNKVFLVSGFETQSYDIWEPRIIRKWWNPVKRGEIGFVRESVACGIWKVDREISQVMQVEMGIGAD